MTCARPRRFFIEKETAMQPVPSTTISTRRRFLAQLASLPLIAGYANIGFVADALASDPDVVFLKKGTPDYEKYRQPFNARMKLKPAVIAVCRTEAGVQKAVAHARKHDLPMAVKSGGHHYEGYSLNDGGLVINVSEMKQLALDGELLTSGPGARVAQVYEYLWAKGRLLPLGSCGGLGIAGLTLGGGHGIFDGKYGLSCDNLLRVRLVDAQGTLHDSNDRPELLWACRGGGNGNFGVVTRLTFKTYPTPATIHSYRYSYWGLKPAKVAALAERWFKVMGRLPPEAYAGFIVAGGNVSVPLLTTGKLTDRRFVAAVEALTRDAEIPASPQSDSLIDVVRSYYGGREPVYFKNISTGFYQDYDQIKPIAAEMFRRVQTSEGLLLQLGTVGTDSPQAVKDAAFPHRGYKFLGQLQAYWWGDSQNARFLGAIDQVRQLISGNRRIRAHYVNYPDIDLKNWAEAYYGSNYRRLQEIKRAYDPENRFRQPQGVELPA
jgi:FAD/FMN-containing dehydrogenase